MAQSIQRTRHTWLLYIILAIFSYVLNGLGPVTPFLKAELNLSYTVSSLHFSLFAVGMILAGVGGNFLVARLGRRRVLWTGISGMCISALGLAAGRTAWVTIAAAFLMGGIGSMILSVVPSGLADEHGERRSIPLSESNVIAAVSGIMAPLVIGWFSYTFLGWRFALVVPLAVLGVVWLVMGKTALVAGQAAAQAQGAGGRLPGRFWVYWVAILLAVAIEFCMISWCADYLEHAAGLPKALAAQAVSVFLGGLILGRIAGSVLILRFSVLRVVMASLLVSLVGFGCFWSAAGVGLTVVGLFITGVGVASQYPLILSLALGTAKDHTVQASARASLASGIAIFSLPLVLGRLADAAGIRQAYGVVLVLILAAMALIWYASRGGK
jgi:fucose permease